MSLIFKKVMLFIALLPLFSFGVNFASDSSLIARGEFGRGADFGVDRGGDRFGGGERFGENRFGSEGRYGDWNRNRGFNYGGAGPREFNRFNEINREVDYRGLGRGYGLTSPWNQGNYNQNPTVIYPDYDQLYENQLYNSYQQGY